MSGKIRNLSFLFALLYSLTVFAGISSAQRFLSTVPQVAAFSTKSLNFGGTNQYASRADSALQDFTTAMTLSVWVKGAAVAGSGIVAKEDYGTTNLAYYIGSAGGAPSKALAVVSASGNFDKVYQTSITVFDSTWHNLVMTFGSSTLKIYVDGVEDLSITKSSDIAVTTLFNANVGLRIGSLLAGGAASAFYTGKVNNVSLWNVALNQTEINALRSGGKPIDLSTHTQFANCKGWYKAGDGDTIAANGILDSSGNSLHLSPTNMVSGDIVTDAP